MIVADSPGLLVRYDAKNAWVCIEFKGFVEGDGYRRPLDEALTFISAKKLTRILWDCRKMRVLTPEDQAWAERDWTPRLAKDTNVRRSAVLVPQSVLAQMSVKRVNDRAAPVMATNELESKTFADQDAAEKWLRAQG
jgi:FAD/FMN-containing dehydrogenase